MASEENGKPRIAQSVWALWVIIVIVSWAYALVVFPEQLRTSMVYILLGLISLIIFSIDNDFSFFKDFRLDLPVNLITWDDFKFRNLFIGVGLAVALVLLSKMTNTAYVGIPTQIGAFTLDRTGQILYVSSVGIVENAIISSFPMAMVAVFFTFLLKENFGFRDPSTIHAIWIIGVILGSLVSGYVAVQYHQVVYANQTANLSGIFLLFTILSLATGLARDSSIADVTHTLYNFSLVFFAIVPLAVAI
jgi:hypothetical protein